MARQLSYTRACRDAAQPAPAPPSAASGSTSNPHAARMAAANGEKNDSAGDARSRLAKLQAQRLEELNRGRVGGIGGAGRPSKPEQRWSNRTLIALATSVGACTYLAGTYHGYKAGKQHALEEIQAGVAAAAPVSPAAPFTAPTTGVQTASLKSSTQATSGVMAASYKSILQLLPFNNLTSSVQCEPEQKQAERSDCRLAELTQYHCDLHSNRVVCQPIDRIFRICKGRPAVEVSHIVEFDEHGKPFLPPHLSEAMPPSQHWHELRSPDL